MTRVLHTGDTHVGYRQYHEPERRADFLWSFERVVEDAIDEDVDAVVHAGDLFHDRRPDLQDLQGVVAALRDLSTAGIPFLAIVGNHEAKRAGQWLDLFADLDLAERLGEEPRIVGDLALYGLDHVPQSQRDGLEYEFAEPGREDGSSAPDAVDTEPADDAEPDDEAESAADAESAVDATALVAHGLFTPFDPGEWNSADLLDRATVDFDAMLLGDNHDPGTQQVEDTWVTYPGSTERASASERADRGYNLVTVEDGDLRIARRTIETREFVFVDVELAAGEGGEVVRDRVREFDHGDAVTVVTIEGDGEPVTPGPIEELALEQGALVARVNDRRDVETEDETVEVSFADPDEAVRQRLRELGLSEAARDLDRVIRDATVADANVRESARRHVDEHLEEGLEGFESVPAEEVEAGDDETAHAGTDGEPGSDPDTEADERATGTDGAAVDDPETTGPAAAADEGTDDQASADEPSADQQPDDDPTDDTPTDDEPAEDAEETAAGADGQASMEEYL